MDLEPPLLPGVHAAVSGSSRSVPGVFCDHGASAAPSQPIEQVPESDLSLVAGRGLADGSNAIIEYRANTDPSLPEDRIELSCGGSTSYCDNFRGTTLLDAKDLHAFNRDSGRAMAIEDIVDVLRNRCSSPFTPFEFVGVSETTLAKLESAITGRAIRLDE